jgi:hypothetical protein
MAVTGFSPLFFPADTITRTTSAAVTKGQLLYISGDNTVAPTTAATSAWIGVAAFDAASGADVTVYTEGVLPMTASGSITAGDLVVAAAAGAVATSGAITTANSVQIVGKALAGATNGNPVNVLLP